MKGKKYRIQINLDNDKSIFIDTSAEAKVDAAKEAYNTQEHAKEFLLYANVGGGAYEMVDWAHKVERRIGFQ